MIRGKPPNAGKHWSAEPTFGFGQRANFRVPAAESNTALVIKVQECSNALHSGRRVIL